MTRRERWLWGALAVALLATRLPGLGDRAFSHDESLHGYYSWQLATKGVFAHDPMMHGPLLFHLNALVFRLLGAGDGTARLTAALAGIGAVLLLVAYRPLLGRKAAFAAAALAALSPSIWFYSRYMRNETYVALACLLWILGAFRYLGSRRRTDLATMVLGLTIAFVAKEVAFLFGLTIGLFCAALALARARRGGESLRTSAAADLALTMGVLVAPFLGALLYRPLGWATTAYDTAAAPWHALVTCGALAVAALAAGLLWLRGRRSGDALHGGVLALLAGGFWGVAALLFTTLGSNFPRGAVSGFVGSLGYWLAQHGVRRGGQPGYYYLMLVALYEMLPLACALAASGLAVRRLRRRGAVAVPAADLPEARVETTAAATVPDASRAGARRALLAFLLWWSAAGIVLYSLAGEKMPWLTVHIVLPWCLLGGWGLARGFETAGGAARLRRSLLAAAVAAGALATGWAGWRLVFRDYDLATEMLVYAHGTPDLHRIVELLAERRKELPPGRRLVVAHDSPSSWPLLWYLRDDERRYLAQEPKASDFDGADAVLLAPEASRKAWPLLAREFEEHELLQLWWPVESYRDPSRLLEPEGRRAVVEYLLFRRLPGVEVGPHWPLRQELRLWMHRPGAPRGAVPILEAPVLPFDLPRAAAEGVPVPVAVAASAAGLVAVGDPGGGRVLRFDRALRPLPSLPREGRIAAQGLAFGDDGTLAVADPEAGRVVLLDDRGRELAAWPPRSASGATSERRPVGIVAVPGGFAVADELGRELCRLDARLTLPGACVELGFAPQSLTGSPGALLLADSAGRRVVRLADGSAPASSWRVPGWEGLPESGRPGLASLDGWVLASDPMARRLLVFAAGGELAAAVEPHAAAGGPLWVHPAGLAADPAGGRLLLVDRDAGKLYALPLAALRSALASLPGSSR